MYQKRRIEDERRVGKDRRIFTTVLLPVTSTKGLNENRAFNVFVLGDDDGLTVDSRVEERRAQSEEEVVDSASSPPE